MFDAEQQPDAMRCYEHANRVRDDLTDLSDSSMINLASPVVI